MLINETRFLYPPALSRADHVVLQIRDLSPEDLNAAEILVALRMN